MLNDRALMVKKALTFFLILPLLCCASTRHSDKYADKSDIRDLINKWAFARDQEKWQQLNNLAVEDAQISLSWYCGPYMDFVSLSKNMAAGDSNLLKHKLGVPKVEIFGDRALAETNVDILVRANTPFGEIDSSSSGRFLDLLVKTDHGWKIHERIAIYEKDRVDPVGGTKLPAIFYQEAKQYPRQIQFLAQALARLNKDVSPQVILDQSETMHTLYARSNSWLTAKNQRTFAADCSTH